MQQQRCQPRPGGRLHVARRRGWGVWRVVGLAALAASPAAAQQPTVTLADAIAAAERTQPRTIRAAGGVNAAGARVRAAWGDYLPRLYFSTSGGTSYADGLSYVNSTGQVVSGGSTYSSFGVGIGASIELFTGFRRGAELASARASADAAAATLTDAKQQERLAATNQFFDALAAQQLVRVADAGVRRAGEQHALAVAKFGAGTATRSDTLRSLVTLGSAHFLSAQAEARLVTAEAALGRLIGRAERVRAADDSTLYRSLPALDTTALLTGARAQAPQIQIARADHATAAAGLRAARSSYWPSLSLSANSGWNGSDANRYQLFNQRSLNLGLSWSPFTGFQREAQIAAQRAALDGAAAAMADAERLLVTTLISQLANLETARQNVESATVSRAAAIEDLDVQQERYRVGLSTIVDVLMSQEALAQAEVNAVTARFDYLRARAQIEALVGHAL